MLRPAAATLLLPLLAACAAAFAKMGLLVFVLILEVWPMITLIRWRRSLARDPGFDAGSLGDNASMIAMISYVQCLLVVGMVLTAAGMARGFGSR
ncbi:MAG: DUF2214 family protein [Gemmatimonadaceae bacterium]